MIILTATMHPHGNPAQAYELLHATIENRTRIEDFDPRGGIDQATERYLAHVLSRPNRWIGVSGYEADVEVKGHRRADGPAPLIRSVLHAAVNEDGSSGFVLPEARRLARVTIEDAAAFEQRLRARS